MLLHRLYSNRPHVFQPIVFNEGLSVVVAEIRIPENRELDTHNLGKTTVGELLDFCLLKGKDPSFFLFKHPELFENFTFFLEVILPDDTYLTIGRRVDPGSRIEMTRTRHSVMDANELAEDDWDHYDLAFERARDLLDGYLAFETLKPWRFRKLVGYLIRSQQDYQQVFQLGKFSGKHIDWKPFVAHLLGFPAQPAIDLYEKKAQLDETTSRLATLNQEWSGDDADPSLLDGLIAVKRRQVEEQQATLDSFNFNDADRATTEEVVERVEREIVSLNEERYQLQQLTQQLESSLERRTIVFKPEAAAKLFEEAGVLFAEQLSKDFDQLIDFNRAIADERRTALQEQLDAARNRITQLDDELEPLNEQRAASLEYLRDSDALSKYKDLSRRLTKASAELSTLESRREAAARLVELRQQRRELTDEFNRLQTSVEEMMSEMSSDESSQFAHIRRYFTEIINSVLGANAVLAMNVNSQGGIDFRAEFVGDTGIATSGDRGTSYKKLLCIAFDLAVLRAHLDERFPRFVFLDGAFEQLEARKQERLLAVFRDYAQIGLQPVVTALDSDLPSQGNTSLVAEADVVLQLHDEGDNGRLFRMAAW